MCVWELAGFRGKASVLKQNAVCQQAAVRRGRSQSWQFSELRVRAAYFLAVGP